jgi:hypothetical protein
VYKSSSSSSSEHFRVRPGEPVPNTQGGLGRSIVVWVVRGLIVLVCTNIVLKCLVL